MNRGIFNIRLNWLILAFRRYSIHFYSFNFYSFNFSILFNTFLIGPLSISNWELINRIRFRDSPLQHSLQREREGGGSSFAVKFSTLAASIFYAGSMWVALECTERRGASFIWYLPPSLPSKGSPPSAGLKEDHHLTAERLQPMWHIGSSIDIDCITGSWKLVHFDSHSYQILSNFYQCSIVIDIQLQLLL